jgi:hypothetical protein
MTKGFVIMEPSIDWRHKPSGQSAGLVSGDSAGLVSGDWVDSQRLADATGRPLPEVMIVRDDPRLVKNA